MADFKNALPVGAKLGKYTIEKTLGAGGFAITYKVSCYQGNIKQSFAVKEYFPSEWCERKGERMTYAASVKDDVKNGLESFVTEAKRLSHPELRHDNLVGVNEIFRANDTAYYVMEFIDGVSLYKYVKKYISDYGHPLPENAAKAILQPVLVTISVLHKNLITHLDIKPDNIMLGETKEKGVYRPVVIDLGLSRHYDDKGRVTAKIKSLACTPGYAPNEVYQEEGLRNFTPQSDVYSLGATLYFMLTGKTPEVAGTISQNKILTVLNSAPGEGISEQTKMAIVNAMRNHLEERTQSVRAFAKELGLDLSSELDDGPSEGVVTVPIRNKRIGSILKDGKWWGVAVCIALIAAVAVYWLNRENKIEPVVDDTKTEMNILPADSVVAPSPSPAKEEKEEEVIEDEKETVNSTVIESDIITEDPSPVRVTEGELDLGYAVWKGGIKDRKPHGSGKMLFKSDHTIVGVEVHEGYRMEGQYENGKLVIGEFYDANGKLYETRMP